MTCSVFNLQLALAIAINKAKPEDVSIKDWLQTLRQYIRKDRDQTAPPDAGSYIDTSAFWQSEFTRCQKALELEQNQSFLLKQENTALKERLHLLETQSSGSVSSKKRKATEGITHRASKRIRQETKSVPASFAIDFESLNSGEPGVKALRNLHQLFILFRGNMYGVDPTKLAYHLSQTTLALTTIVDSLHTRPNRANSTFPLPRLPTSPEEEEERSPLETVNAIARGLTTLLYGLERLSSLSGSSALVNRTNYHIASLIDSIFTAIEAAATTEARYQLTTERITGSSSSNNSNSSKQPTNKPLNCSSATTATPTQTLMTALTNTLIALLSTLNTELPSHAALLESLLYHLLHRLGEMLHHATFSCPRPTSMPDAIRNLPPPPPSAAESLLDPARRVDRRAMALVAPGLIAVLKRAVAAVPAGWVSDKPLGLQRKYYLVCGARERLQRTLVGCVFGTGGDGREDDTGDGGGRGSCDERRFEREDVLRRPELGAEIAVPEVGDGQRDRDEAVEEWFEGELWALLGWDVLASKKNLAVR